MAHTCSSDPDCKANNGKEVQLGAHIMSDGGLILHVTNQSQASKVGDNFRCNVAILGQLQK